MQAADPVRVPIEPSDSGQAYLKATAGRGIISDTDYYDPNHPAPELKINTSVPEKPDKERNSTVTDKLVTFLIFGTLLAGVVFVVMQFGGARLVSFAQAPSAGRRRQSASVNQQAGWSDGADTIDVDEIGKIADRRDALMHLARRSLNHAAAANGLRIARSWTMRDTLRRLPEDWPHLAALRSIASASEVAHFGGRAVPEDTFQSLFGLARSIFSERST